MATGHSALRPGKFVELAFPELPQSLFTMACKRGHPPKLLAALPRNYRKDRTYPLFVFLRGGQGAGGRRVDVTHAKRIIGDKDVISVSMPLFKKDLDPEEPFSGLMLGAGDDYPLISRCYRKMLTRLFKTIPNASKGMNAIGGFSNGAHTVSVLLNSVDRFTLRHFRTFFLLDGGFYITSMHKTALWKKNFAYFVGGDRKDKVRRNILRLVTSVSERAKRYKINMKVRRMPGIGHAFPDKYHRELREWVRSHTL